MRSAPIVVTCCALAGCAALSGLDQLSLGPADAATPADSSPEALSADGGLDAAGDAPSDANAVCVYEAKAQGCFGQNCQQGSACCVGLEDASCGAPCSATTVAMGCTSSVDCIASTQPVCCLENVGQMVIGCPLVLETSQNQGAASECTSNDLCNGSGHGRLCNTSTDCPIGQQCEEAALSINKSKIFGLCR